MEVFFFFFSAGVHRMVFEETDQARGGDMWIRHEQKSIRKMDDQTIFHTFLSRFVIFSQAFSFFFSRISMMYVGQKQGGGLYTGHVGCISSIISTSSWDFSDE